MNENDILKESSEEIVNKIKDMVKEIDKLDNPNSSRSFLYSSHLKMLELTKLTSERLFLKLGNFDNLYTCDTGINRDKIDDPYQYITALCLDDYESIKSIRARSLTGPNHLTSNKFVLDYFEKYVLEDVKRVVKIIHKYYIKNIILQTHNSMLSLFDVILINELKSSGYSVYGTVKEKEEIRLVKIVLSGEE